jgi:hypothetical protein
VPQGRDNYAYVGGWADGIVDVLVAEVVLPFFPF